jgi:cell division protein FtsQ
MMRARERPVVRPSGLPVRRGRIRRASAGLSPLRAGAAFVMVVAALAIYGVGASPAFGYRHLDFQAGPAAHTSTEAVVGALGLDVAAPNLFVVQTDRLQSRLLALPAVVDAQVSLSLPDTIRVWLTERQPILVWIVGGRRLLVDRSGMAFAETVPGGPGDGLATITDHRAAWAGLEVGQSVDPVDLDAATRLASVVPANLGTKASGLRVWIEDSDGFEIHPIGVPWVAAFGVYTPSLRTTELVPGQVRLLKSFLAGRELTVKRVLLADDRNGTWVPR